MNSQFVDPAPAALQDAIMAIYSLPKRLLKCRISWHGCGYKRGAVDLLLAWQVFWVALVIDLATLGGRCRLHSRVRRRSRERGFRHHRRRSDGITNQEWSDDATIS
jgi:hypothetical protein